MFCKQFGRSPSVVPQYSPRSQLQTLVPLPQRTRSGGGACGLRSLQLLVAEAIDARCCSLNKQAPPTTHFTPTMGKVHMPTTRTRPMKKALGETQTLRAGCSKAEEKIRPAADPLPGGAGRPKFNQLEMVTTFTYRPSLVKIDACNFELSW